MWRSLLVALLITSVLSVGCGKDGPGPNGPLTGDWQGQSNQETVTLTLTQSGGTINGTGLIHNGQNATSLTVLGNHSPPYVHLDLGSMVYQDWTFSGRLTGSDSLTGVFNGSGFTNFGVVFVRQP